MNFYKKRKTINKTKFSYLDNTKCSELNETNNIARNRPAFQVAVNFFRPAFRAVDCNVQMSSHFSFTNDLSEMFSDLNEDTWFLVDLQAIYNVFKVCLLGSKG